MTETFGAPKEIISSIYEINPVVLEEIAQWLETRGIRTPLSQVVGFRQYIPVLSPIDTQETTTSTGYTNLATVGPALNNLADGIYVVMWSCLSTAAVGDTAVMGISLNGGAPDDLRAIWHDGTDALRLTSFNTYQFATNSQANTIVAKYKSVAGGVATFQGRVLMAMRVQ